MRLLLILLFVAAPLSAQQTVIVPDVEITNEHPITNEVTVEALSDSVMLARIADILEGMRNDASIKECCTNTGTSGTTKLAVGILIPALLWIGWELRGIKNNSAGTPGADGMDGQDGADGADGESYKRKHY